MKPIDFQGTNIQLNKPSNMTDEQCQPIRAFKGTNDDGYPQFITAWQPSQEEIDLIVAGNPVWLSVLSSGFAPASIFVAPLPVMPEETKEDLSNEETKKEEVL